MATKKRKDTFQFYDVKSVKDLEEYIKEKGLKEITQDEWDFFSAGEWFRTKENMKKYEKYINWEWFTIFPPKPEIIELYKEKLEWRLISLTYDINMTFIKKYKKYLFPGFLVLNPSTEAFETEMLKLFPNANIPLTREQHKKAIKIETKEEIKEEVIEPVKKGRGRPSTKNKNEDTSKEKKIPEQSHIDVKRGRGRPPKNINTEVKKDVSKKNNEPSPAKKGRGRPRKS